MYRAVTPDVFWTSTPAPASVSNLTTAVFPWRAPTGNGLCPLFVSAAHVCVAANRARTTSTSWRTMDLSRSSPANAEAVSITSAVANTSGRHIPCPFHGSFFSGPVVMLRDAGEDSSQPLPTGAHGAGRVHLTRY